MPPVPASFKRPHKFFLAARLVLGCCVAVSYASACHASSIPACTFFVRMSPPGVPDDRPRALVEQLALASNDEERLQCIGQFLSERSYADEDRVTLRALVQSRDRPELRARAVVVLWHLIAPTPARPAKFAQWLKEEDEPVVAAALMSVLVASLAPYSSQEWTGEFMPADVAESIISWNPEKLRTSWQEVHAVRLHAMRKLMQELDRIESPMWTSDSDARFGNWRGLLQPVRRNRQLWDGIVERSLSALGASGSTAEENAQAQANSHAALDLLATLAANGHLARAEKHTGTTYFKHLLPELGEADPVRRAGAARALTEALLAYSANADPLWHDTSDGPTAATRERLGNAFALALSDPHAPLRAQAARGLGAQPRHSPERIAALCTLLADSDSTVRIESASALARLRLVPDAGLEALIRMAESSTEEAPAAIAALSNSAAPAVIASLLRVASRERAPENEALGDWQTPPPNEPSRLAYRALRKIGQPAVLPMLAHLAVTKSGSERADLLGTLRATGWDNAIESPGQLAAALEPALALDDAEMRSIAIDMLAHWRLQATQPYPNATAETAAAIWFSIPAGAPAVEPPSTDAMVLAPDNGYADSDVRAAIVIGNSRSAPAARSMIKWMCCGRRLQTASVMNVALGKSLPNGQLDTIRDSLAAMGSVAVLPVVEALARGASRHCQETLMETLAQFDIDRADPALMERLREEISRARPGVRTALRRKLTLPTHIADD